MLIKLANTKKKVELFNDKFENENSMPNDLLDLSVSITSDLKSLLIETLARNLVAWENSKDKSDGLLPEIYLDNKCVYEELTGEEFSLRRAMKKYYE